MLKTKASYRSPSSPRVPGLDDMFRRPLGSGFVGFAGSRGAGPRG